MGDIRIHQRCPAPRRARHGGHGRGRPRWRVTGSASAAGPMRSASTRRAVSGASATTAGGAPDRARRGARPGGCDRPARAASAPAATISPGRAPTRVTTPPIGDASRPRVGHLARCTAPAATARAELGPASCIPRPSRRPATGARRIPRYAPAPRTTSPATRAPRARSARAQRGEADAEPGHLRTVEHHARSLSSATRLGAMTGASRCPLSRAPPAPVGEDEGPGSEGEEDEHDSKRSASWRGSSSRGLGQGSGRGARVQSPVAASSRCPRRRAAARPPAGRARRVPGAARARALEPGDLAPLVAGAVALHQGARGRRPENRRRSRRDRRRDNAPPPARPCATMESWASATRAAATFRAASASCSAPRWRRPRSAGRARASVQRWTP